MSDLMDGEGRQSSTPNEGQEPAHRFLSGRRLGVLVGLAVVLALLAFFVADNFVLVQVRVFTVRIQARLAWVMVMPFVLGIGIGWGAHAGRAWWRNRTARR